ncbi:MAG: NADPH-dependent FMN reductase [Ilumatobacteraceae bacterium]
MTRLLTICGSLQQVSMNRAALDVVHAFAATIEGVSVDQYADLGQLPALNPDLVSDPGPEVSAWRRRVGRADVVLIASPEYAGSLAGSVKNALDWIVGSGELYTKPVAVLSAGTTGGWYARQALVQTLTWQGAHVVAELGIAAPRTKSDRDGRLTDETTIDAIHQVAAVLLDAPHLAPDARLALVRAIVDIAGVDAHHIAPIT